MKIAKLEYQVRKVERYIITRYVEEDAEDGRTGCAESSTRGEFDNPDQAWETAYALCKLEHEQHTDFAPGDERVQYPRHPLMHDAAQTHNGGDVLAA